MTKSDAELKQDVLAELEWDPSVNAAGIGVEVNYGIVTLAGHVTSYTEKLNAEDAAQRIFGVKAFTTRIRVSLASADKRDDTDIAKSAQNTLDWLFYSPEDAFKILVENGWVTLFGKVEWEFQRKLAIDAIRGLAGVVGVSNKINIQHKINSSNIKLDIEAALKRRANGVSKTIIVETSNGAVTLSGSAQSWSERALASSTAWASLGVNSVINNIEIAN